MIKHRTHHWTCSRFADWIRGEKKPFALEFDQWGEWESKQKQERPLRYWLSDTVLKRLQDIVYFPLDVTRSIRRYIRNRWITKTHLLKTGLIRGQWYDFDTRIIHGLFNELVNFVEIELAHLSKFNEDKNFKFRRGRSIEAAYYYFEWAESLKDFDGKKSQQAKDARKIRELYEWWTKIRPNRINPHESNDCNTTLKKAKKAFDIEDQYLKEDTQMLISLIKLRSSLWT